MSFHLGTSGYCYAHWAKIFYAGVPQKQWLQHYAKVFRTVELNNTFYRLPKPEMVDGWRKNSPRGFMFAVKGSRFLTHMKRLLDRGEGLEKFFVLVSRLGPKLGPVLWQLPPQMKTADTGRLDAFLEALPKHTRHAVEFRSDAWYTKEVVRVLDKHGAAFCEHDLVQKRVPAHTGGWRYVRFHGATGKYQGRYKKTGLRRWAKDFSSYCQRADAYVYFNNDLQGHALMDAMDLSDLMGERVPLELHLEHSEPQRPTEQ